MEFSVRLELETDGTRLDEDDPFTVVEALEALGAAGPIGSYAPYALGLRFALKAPGAAAAVLSGEELVRRALEEADLPRLRVVEVEAQTLAALRRGNVRRSAMPEIVGAGEVARMLGISRQRASALARSREFPSPVAFLAAGPVWRTAQVIRHLANWPRRVGRPRGESPERG